LKFITKELTDGMRNWYTEYPIEICKLYIYIYILLKYRDISFQYIIKTNVQEHETAELLLIRRKRKIKNKTWTDRQREKSGAK
jgi:hypothetical protein